MLYGMQGMSSDVPEVRSVLCFLHAGQLQEPLKLRQVGNMLYGMGHEQRWKCVSAGYASWVLELEPLKAQNVGNMLYGMQGNDSSAGSASVLNMLPAGAPQLRNEWRSERWGTCCTVCRGMSSDAPEVRSVLICF
jgi:hypothetical protein